MIALDTNVLARYLLADEVSQSRVAAALLRMPASNFGFRSRLCSNWHGCCADRRAPRRRRHATATTARIAGDPATLPESIVEALRLAEQGIDVADAMHLALSRNADRFATFDEALSVQARRLRTRPPVSAP